MVNLDLDQLSLRDFEWRRSQLEKLKDSIRSIIEKLQNPADCNTARKITCQLNKGCGFGCQIHHVAYCLITGMIKKF